MANHIALMYYVTRQLSHLISWEHQRAKDYDCGVTEGELKKEDGIGTKPAKSNKSLASLGWYGVGPLKPRTFPMARWHLHC